MIETVDLDSVNTYKEGKLQLIVGLCEKCGIREIFDRRMKKDNEVGRKPLMSPGMEAMVMLAGICVQEGYRSLYAMNDFYADKDLEGIFHFPIEPSWLQDDRFGNFLDDFFDSNCRSVFLEASGRAFAEYGIAVKNINYDTTSKVMWGEYSTTDEDDKVGCISIDFGYSKDKRGDKKQLKIGLGTTNGIVTDAKVLSGNKDDKTYNFENMEDADKLLSSMNVNREEFYYIADSALFTKKNIAKANQYHIKYITRMPDNIKVASKQLDKPLPESAQPVSIINAHDEEVLYKLIEAYDVYEGHPCKLAVVYSYALEETKRKSLTGKVDKERLGIEEKLKHYENRLFKCLPDAEVERAQLEKSICSKLKYHSIDLSISEQETKRPGRPSKEPKNDVVTKYKLDFAVRLDEATIEDNFRRECTFVLTSNDLKITGEQMLREYKTQSDVEKRFRVIKSPTYMNSLFLNTPKRIEALVYLLLISVMMLTVAEKTVRDELKKNNEVIHGIENRKQVKPTFSTILMLMDRIITVSYRSGGKTVRSIRSMDESCKKVIKFLRIPESCFAWNPL